MAKALRVTEPLMDDKEVGEAIALVVKVGAVGVPRWPHSKEKPLMEGVPDEVVTAA